MPSRLYNGTVFHRIIDSHDSGGGFDGKLEQRKPTPHPNEAANGLKNTIGTIAMARTADPNSATAQFFINVANNEFLDYKNPSPQGIGYAVFGKVSRHGRGQPYCQTHTGSMKGMDDVPFEPIVIQKVVVKT
jgi:peptidylprolyl isomerase/peptidyl-prolyl cis-trans isomerase A (cyclophilin A)/peptidyl-prolyl cis-trans isomerase B (cyclophilin B)